LRSNTPCSQRNLQRQETEYDFSRSGKRAGFRLWQRRFLNINLSVDDPAIDLAVVAAILSSNEDIPVDKVFVLQEKWACLGNPSGKLRPTHPGSRKIISTIFVSKYNKISLKNGY
jgi:DNA repair protein RadA/Sms